VSLWTAPANPRWVTWPPGSPDKFYMHGVNYPHRDYGRDFGESAWGAEGVSDTATRKTVETHFTAMARLGVQVVRWFVFADGTSGIVFDDLTDQPLSLDPYVLDDLDAAVEVAESRGIRLVFVLLDYLFVRPRDTAGNNGQVHKGGRARTITTYKTDLINHVFEPLFNHFKRTTTVLGWDVINEPELTFVQSESGRLPNGDATAIPRSAIVDLVNDTIAARTNAGCQSLVTVGAYSMHSRSVWEATAVDFLQFHYYDDHMVANSDEDPFAAAQAPATFSKPVVVGEFPVKSTTDVGWNLEARIKTLFEGGFAGAWPWKFREAVAGKDGTDFDLYGTVDKVALAGQAMGNARNHISSAVAPPPKLATGTGADRWFVKFEANTDGVPWGQNTFMSWRLKAPPAPSPGDPTPLSPTNPVTPPADPWDDGCAAQVFINSYAAMRDMRDSLIQAIAEATGYVLITGWRLNPQRDLSDSNSWGLGSFVGTASAASDETIMGLILRLMQAGVRVRVLVWFPNMLAELGGSLESHVHDHAYAWDILRRENERLANAGSPDDLGLLGLDIRTARIAGAHHQKMMVIRCGAVNVAYCGGVDFAFTRREAPDAQNPYQANSFLKGDWQSGTGIPKPANYWPRQAGVDYASVIAADLPTVSSGEDLPADVFGADKQMWHDRHLKLTGPIVATLVDQFRERWLDPSRTYDESLLNVFTNQVIFSSSAAFDPVTKAVKDPVPASSPVASAGTSKIQMWRTIPYRSERKHYSDPYAVFKKRGEFTVMAGVARACMAANELIWICDQYFWSLPLMRLLNQRVRETSAGEGERGTNVLIILPPHADAGFPTRQHQARLRALHTLYQDLSPAQQQRVAVYDLWNPTRNTGIYVHAKAQTYDSTLLVCGSANLNRRSFTCDSELSVAVLDSALVKQHQRDLWQLFLPGTPWPAAISDLDTADSGSAFLTAFRAAAPTQGTPPASYVIPDPFDDSPPTLPNLKVRDDDPSFLFDLVYKHFMDPCSVDLKVEEVIQEKGGLVRPPRLDDVVAKMKSPGNWDD
jgi:phosphatidylserine/phosphatidylglycerophosphate/cardiolipin synthase-like enzyme